MKIVYIILSSWNPAKNLLFFNSNFFELKTVSLWSTLSVICHQSLTELMSDFYFSFAQRVQNSSVQLYYIMISTSSLYWARINPFSRTLQRSLNGYSCDWFIVLWFCFIVLRENQPSGETSIQQLLLAQTCTYLEDEVGLPGKKCRFTCIA